MNAIQLIRRCVILLFIIITIPVCAMKSAVKQKVVTEKVIMQEIQNKEHEPRVEYEFLLYPKNAEIKLDEKLEKEYQRVGNEFRVPKGMDARLIHPTLIPERFDDYKVGHIADAFY